MIEVATPSGVFRVPTSLALKIAARLDRLSAEQRAYSAQRAAARLRSGRARLGDAARVALA